MLKLKVLELFAGTCCLSKAFQKKGHETYTVDIGEQFDVDWVMDCSKITVKDILERFGKPDVLFAGTPCESYYVAAISHHREKLPDGTLKPKTEHARFCDEMNQHVIQLAKELEVPIVIFENPRGGLRKMKFMQEFKCQTTSYCQWGFSYMKPTDFFSNIELYLKPVCKNGMNCHETARRGAQTGLQAIKDPVLKSMYPPLLCDHLADVCEDYIKHMDYPEECRSCLYLTEDCMFETGRCEKYKCRFNQDWKMELGDPIILYNEKESN